MTYKCGDCFTFASFSRLSHDVMSELMLPSLTGTKPVMRTVFGEVNQDDMFILRSNAMSELMSSTLTGIKTAECLFGEKAKYFV